MRNQLRASQLLRPFGPGAMVDLPHDSVLIAGLDDWACLRDRCAAHRIEEPRLQARLRALLECETLLFFAPPAAAAEPLYGKHSVTAWRFPRWFVANIATPAGEWRRRPLVHITKLEGQRTYEYRNPVTGRKEKAPLVAIRFVRACRRGHVSDIPWPLLVHGGPQVTCRRQLYLEERGTSGDLRQILVTCDCGASRPLSDLTVDSDLLGHCRGDEPWLGSQTPVGCTERNQLLVRTASNAWFGQTMSALSIPAHESPIADVVRDHWSDIETVANSVDLGNASRYNQNFRAAIAGFAVDEVLAAIAAHRANADAAAAATTSVKAQEFEVLTRPPVDAPDFQTAQLALDGAEEPWMAPVERVVLVHRLRQVTALVGFTRFEAAGADTTGELSPEVERARLSLNADWLPAIENRGEGVFVQFRAAEIDAWLQRAAVRTRASAHEAGQRAWAGERKRSAANGPSLAYYALHSLSHLLMTAISLDCGYPSTSLAERVYAEEGQYGILILTSSSDPEGTLGGLVEAGRRFNQHLRHALELGALCSNDPVCAKQEPGSRSELQLQGAACHGCLLVAETSCEQGNHYLDRALVVPVMGQPRELALFPAP